MPTNQSPFSSPKLLYIGIVQTPDSPGWYYAAFARTKIVAKNYSFTALILENASKLLAQRYQLTTDEINFGLPTLSTRVASLTCPMPQVSFPCYPGKYRSHNGNCNNVQSPQLGSSSMPFHRYLPAQYSDHVSQPRGSIFYSNKAAKPPKKKKLRRSKRSSDRIRHSSTVNRRQPKAKRADDFLIGAQFKDSEHLLDSKEPISDIYFDSTEWLNSAPTAGKQIRRKRFLQQDDPSPIDPNFGLPDARTVALTMHSSNSLNKKNQDDAGHLTVLMAFFTQFVMHDLAHVAQSVGHKGHRIKCCNIEEGDKFTKHPECWPILINNRKDPIVTQLNQNCMEYVRSSPTIRVGCTLGPREQINQVTSFLDASTVYGSSEEEAKSLRLFSDGLLRGQSISKGNKKKRQSDDIEHQLLPAIETSQDCRSKNRTRCFKSGDIRSNEK